MMANAPRGGAVAACREGLPARRVDDRLGNHAQPRRPAEAQGIGFTLARSTDEAPALAAEHRHAVVLSDMGRPPGPQEGDVLPDTLRQPGHATPVAVHAGTNLPGCQRAATACGGVGGTHRADALFPWLMDAIRAF